MMKRYLAAVLALLIMCGVGVYAGKPASEGASEKSQTASKPPAGPGPAAEKPVVAVAAATESTDVETRRYTGHVVSSASVNIVPRVAGEIVGVLFQEGSIVRRGQPLYELDPVRYEAALKNAEAKVAECKAKLLYAENNYRRYSNLYEQKAATKDVMENSQSEYEAAKALLLAAEASLITAQDDLKNTHIVSPIDGKIGISGATEGNYVTSAAEILATVVQTDPLRISFSMSNRDFLSLFGTEEAFKEKADIRLLLADGRSYASAGAVELIDNRADQRTDTVQVYARFSNPEGKLIPGGTVTVLLAKRNGGLLPAVAPSAVMHDASSAYVYVVTADNVVERRDVVLAATVGGIQLLKSGLAPGELVVVDGMHKTMPGGSIEPDLKG